MKTTKSKLKWKKGLGCHINSMSVHLYTYSDSTDILLRAEKSGTGKVIMCENYNGYAVKKYPAARRLKLSDWQSLADRLYDFDAAETCWYLLQFLGAIKDES